MKQKMYAIQDIKSDTFNAPFCSQNEATALRTVRQAMQGESLLSQYPEDYRLFELGEYDDTRGTITSENEPKWIANLTELAAKGVE